MLVVFSGRAKRLVKNRLLDLRNYLFVKGKRYLGKYLIRFVQEKNIELNAILAKILLKNINILKELVKIKWFIQDFVRFMQQWCILLQDLAGHLARISSFLNQGLHCKKGTAGFLIQNHKMFPSLLPAPEIANLKLEGNICTKGNIFTIIILGHILGVGFHLSKTIRPEISWFISTFEKKIEKRTLNHE